MHTSVEKKKRPKMWNHELSSRVILAKTTWTTFLAGAVTITWSGWALHLSCFNHKWSFSVFRWVVFILSKASVNLTGSTRFILKDRETTTHPSRSPWLGLPVQTHLLRRPLGRRKKKIIRYVNGCQICFPNLLKGYRCYTRTSAYIWINVNFVSREIYGRPRRASSIASVFAKCSSGGWFIRPRRLAALW